MGDCKNLISFASWRSKIGAWPQVVLRLALLIAPLLIGLAWGPIFDDGAYAAFRCARSLAAGRELTYDPAEGLALGKSVLSVAEGVEGGQTLLKAPLYVLALALPVRLGVPLLWAALVLGALGWGVAAVAIYSTIHAMRRPVTAVVPAALLPF